MSKFTRLQLQDGIGQVVLNRPDSYNALDLATARELADVLHGLNSDAGGAFTLPRLVGLARALEIAAFDEPIPAAQALAWGLVANVTPAAEPLDHAARMAQTLLQRSLHTFGWSKQLLTDAFDTSLETQLERERQRLVSCASHRDGLEGMQTFLEKRPPRYNPDRPISPGGDNRGDNR